MNPDPHQQNRLERLVGLAQKELRHLQLTDERLFSQPFDAERAASLDNDVDLSERVDAFVARFGRLQDTVGDKLLPAWLTAHGEKTETFIDNLDRAERLGLIEDAQAWFDMRRLRNQMIHEYVEDPQVLASALQAGHAFVPTLAATVELLAKSAQHDGP